MYGLPIDDVDVKILTMLQEDCSRPTARIADEVNLSITPCYRRIKRLEKEGYIKRYKAELNSHLLGFLSTCFIKVKVRRNAPREDFLFFEQEVVNHPNVSGVFRVACDFDFLIMARFRDTVQFNELICSVYKCKLCVEADYLLVTDEYKNNQRLDLVNLNMFS